MRKELKKCENCTYSGRCKFELYFKDEKINSCPDFTVKAKTK